MDVRTEFPRVAENQDWLSVLGAAVIAQWSNLPGDVSAVLLEQATLISRGSPTKKELEDFVGRHQPKAGVDSIR